VIVKTAATSVQEMSSSLNFIKVTTATDVSHSDSFIIRPLLFNLQTPEVELANHIFPNSGFLRKNEFLFFSIQNLPEGFYGVKYTLEMQISESRKYGFQIDGSNNEEATSVFRVYRKNQVLPAPVFSSVDFSNDGSLVLIKFDSSTNMAGLSNIFLCSELFEFTCSSSSICQWSDSQTVAIAIKASSSISDTCVQPGDYISFLPKVNLTAACSLSQAECSTWPKSTPKSPKVLPPITAVSPSIVMNTPETIGQCSSLTVDLSSSYGNGGRSWSNVSIIVEGLAQNISSLNYYLSSHSQQLSPPLVIPSYYFEVGYSYLFRVMLCNFLNKCSEKSRAVAVSSSLLPSMTIVGSSSRTMTVKQPLSLVSSASVMTCDGKSSTLGITYEWKLYDSLTGSGISVVSAAKDPSRFILPSYSLNVSSAYTVECSAAYKGKSSKAIVSVSTVPGSLIAVVQGGNNQAVRVGSVITLDGSKSFDTDKKNGYGKQTAGLSYSWSCIQILPSLNSSCRHIFPLFDDDVPSESLSLAVPASSTFLVNYQVQITMTIYDIEKKRSASSTITVQILSALSATITLGSTSLSTSQNIINADQSLILYSTVSIPSGLSANLSWSSTQLDLSKVVLTPLVSRFASSSVASPQVISFDLKIASAALSGGTSYSFALKASLSSPGVPSFITITVMVNAPPVPGIFSVSPISGEELSTPFSFSASRWLDDQLPLQYSFRYRSQSGNMMTIKSLSESSYVSSILLPSGSSSQKFYISCFVEIFDSFLASSTAFSMIQVNQSSFLASNTSLVQSYLKSSSSALESTNLDSIKQAAALNNYLLNSVNGSSGSPSSSSIDKSAYREKVMNAIVTMTSLEEPSSQTVSGWIDYMLETTHRPEELTLSSGKLALALVNNITKTVAPAGLATESMNKALNVLSSIARKASSGNRRLVASLSDGEGFSIGDLHSSIVNYAAAMSLSIMTGENAVNQITDNIKLNMQTVTPSSSSSSKVPSSSSNTVSAESAECKSFANTNIPDTTSSFRLPTCQGSQHSEQSKALNIAGFTVSASLYDNAASFESDPLSLYLSHIPCDDVSSCKVTVVLKRSYKKEEDLSNRRLSSSSSGVVWHNVTCAAGDYSSHFFNDCPSGLNYTVHCNGSYSMIHSRCPVKKMVPSCNVLLQDGSVLSTDSASAAAAVCEMISYTSETVTCSCLLASSSTLARRSLLGNSSSIIEEEDGIVAVSYVAMLQEIQENFEKTILSAGSLNEDKLAKGWQALVVIGSLIGAIIMALTFSVKADQRAKDTDKNKHNKVDASTEKMMSDMLGGAGGRKASSSPILEKIASEKQQSNKSELLRLPSSVGVSASIRVGVEHSMSVLEKGKSFFQFTMESSIPTLFTSKKSLKDKILEEFKRHHRWIGVIYYYSERFPRALRVLSLSTNIIIMLFVQSLTYDLNKGDDGTCAEYHNEVDCLTPLSAYATGSSKCYWTPSTPSTSPTGSTASATGTCSYLQPDNSIEVILFVAIFSAIISTPLAILADWVIIHILAAPSLTPSVSATGKKMINNVKVNKVAPVNQSDISRPSFLGVASRTGSVNAEQSLAIANQIPVSLLRKNGGFLSGRKRSKSEEEIQEFHTIYHEFEKLIYEIKDYRVNVIVDPEERQEFDGKYSLVCSCSFFSYVFLRFLTFLPVGVLLSLPFFTFPVLTCLFACSDMWGLDGNGSFRKKGDLSSSFRSWLWYKMMSLLAQQEDHISVAEVILNELQTLYENYKKEKMLFATIFRNEKEKGKRLLYLFQKDLLPGIQGMILESKMNRDNKMIKATSRSAKLLAWFLLSVCNIGMLFYILLFALSQEPHRQEAWGQSFALWLVVEVGIVGSLSVLIMHVLIPFLSMKDILSIQKRLRETVAVYQEKLQQNQNMNGSDSEEEDSDDEYDVIKDISSPKAARSRSEEGKKQGKTSGAVVKRKKSIKSRQLESEDDIDFSLEEEVEADSSDHRVEKKRSFLKEIKVFNAARYLYLSHRLANHYKDSGMMIAKIILSFSSPWPKQSYQYVTNISSSYEQSSSGLSRASSIILLFFLSSLLSMPVSIQDTLIHVFSTVIGGYVILIHYQLYSISAGLVIIPGLTATLIIGTIAYYCRRWIKRSKAKKEEKKIKNKRDPLTLLQYSSKRGSVSSSVKENQQQQQRLPSTSVKVAVGGPLAASQKRQIESVASIDSQEAPVAITRRPFDHLLSAKQISSRSFNNNNHQTRRQSVQQGLATVQLAQSYLTDHSSVSSLLDEDSDEEKEQESVEKDDQFEMVVVNDNEGSNLNDSMLLHSVDTAGKFLCLCDTVICFYFRCFLLYRLCLLCYFIEIGNEFQPKVLFHVSDGAIDDSDNEDEDEQEHDDDGEVFCGGMNHEEDESDSNVDHEISVSFQQDAEANGEEDDDESQDNVYTDHPIVD
jgi:hypothetical protein